MAILLSFGIIAVLLSRGINGQVFLEISRPSQPDTGSHAKRDITSVDLDNTLQWGGSYRTKFKVGTPGQFITLGITTRPSTLAWVPASNSSACEETTIENYGPCSFGGFDADASSSFEPLDEPFALDQDDNSKGEPVYVRGTKFTDELRLGDTTLSNFTMAYADNITNDIIPEVSLLYFEDYDEKESNFLYQIWKQGHIPTLGYSLWLGSQTGDAGQLQLGAIDTEKYEGDLVSFDSGSSLLELPLTSLSAKSPSGTDVLDSQLPISIPLLLGTAFSVLPQDIAMGMWAAAGVKQLFKGYLPILPCALRDSQGYFTLEFGGDDGVKINLTMKELVLEEGIYDPELFPDDDGPLCAFGVRNSTKPQRWILNQVFFRSAYSVVDLANQRVAIAPVKPDAKLEQSKIVSFEGNGAPIPSATQLKNQPTVPIEPSSSPTLFDWKNTGKTYSAAKGFQSLSTDQKSSAGDGEENDRPNDSGLSTGAKAGIGVGVGVAVMFLLAGAFFLWKKRRQDNHQGAVVEGREEYHGKPELSGEAMSPAAVSDWYSQSSPSELQGNQPAFFNPVEIDGRERAVEMHAEHAANSKHQ